MALGSQELGTLAELRFQMRCLERGAACYAPIIGTNKAVDYVIELDGQLRRIQVKKASVKLTNGCPGVSATISSPANNGSKYRYAQDFEGMFDFYAFVCLELNTVWLVPQADVTTTCKWSKSIPKLSEIAQYIF